MERLHGFLLSIKVGATDAIDRLNGDKDQSFLIDILGDIQQDTKDAIKIAVQDEEL